MIGATLGPYRIDRELGSGGMGKVYAATVADGGMVALKIIHPHLLADPDALARFQREAAVGVSIRHANVVATLASGEEGGCHWLALEYVEGHTLHALREELGTVPEELCRHVAHEVAAGLAAIHAAGIVHRDLKPENVLITKEHVVKVMDLGVARGVEDDVRVTKSGAFVGSLQYAAPEQFVGGGKGLDGRADLHALGVLLYELATGANPFADADWRVVFQRVLKETPRRLGAVNPQVSPFFEEVVHTLLAKDREQRFASATELASVLEAGEDAAWWTARARSIRGATRRPLRRVRIPRETALVGRDVETAKLRAAFERAKAGDGAVVLVEGEAGIGKSRLVDEFVALLQREGEDIDFLYGSYPPGGAATASGAFSTAYREHFGSEGLEDALAGPLAPTPLLVPGFAALLTNQAPPEGALALTKDSLQTCFVHATRAIAAERVAVVLIDDLHFAPDEGRGLFAALTMAVPGHRVLLAGTSRPPLDEKWVANMTRLGHTTRVPLGRLGARDLVALLKDALRSSHLAEELSAKLAEKTDGNPFFVFEVLRSLKDGQYLTQRPDGTWATTKVIHEIQIPSSIADLVQARLGDLTEDERSLLEIAACAGFEFDPALVGDVAGLGQIPLLKALGTIEKAHRLIRAAGRRYVFDHHQVQEHLYGGLGEFAREGYHAAIAASLERMHGAAGNDPGLPGGALCVDLAEHFLKGGEGARAMRYLDAALTHLEKGYLNDAAVRLADRALSAPGLVAGNDRCGLLLRKAVRLDLLGGTAATAAALEEARTLADATGDAALGVRARNALGSNLVRTADFEGAQRVLGEALLLARRAEDRRGEAGATGALGIVLAQSDRFAEAKAHFERSLALMQEAGDREGEAGATINLGIILMELGRLAEAQRQHEVGAELARAAGDRRFEANAVGNLANVFKFLCRFAEAQTHYERQLVLVREIGHRQGETNALCELGSTSLLLGRTAAARETLAAALALSREVGALRNEGYALLGLGRAADEEGDSAEAQRLMTESLALRRKIGHAPDVCASLIELGDLCRRAGDVAGARAALEEARDLAREQGGTAAVVLALVATLPGGPPRDGPRDALVPPGDMARAAEDAFARAEGGVAPGAAARVRFLLWTATGDRAHLAEAKRLLDRFVADAPEDCRTSMLANVRLHREILAASKTEGL